MAIDKTKNIRFLVTLPLQVHEKIKDISETSRISMSKVCNVALEEFLLRREEPQKEGRKRKKKSKRKKKK